MPAPRVTTDEYLRMPETLRPQELVWGVVRDAPAPMPGHQWTVGSFYVVLREHLEATGFGRIWMSPIDVVLDRTKHLVVQPDLIVIAEARIGMVSDRVWGAPDLVVEILSPRPRIGKLEERLAWFAEYGVREGWLVHEHRQNVEVVEFASGSLTNRRRFEPDESIRSVVLPGFSQTPRSILER